MAKSKVIYFCTERGSESLKWQGKCPVCGAWNTMVEHTEKPTPVGKSRSAGDLERFFIFWYEQKDLLEALMRNRLSGLLVERATNHALQEHLMPAYLLSKDETIQHLALTFSVCGLLWFHTNFRVIGSVSIKNTIGVLIGLVICSLYYAEVHFICICFVGSFYHA